MRYIVTFLTLLFSLYAKAQPGTINLHTENSQVIRNLSGYTWKMKKMNPGEGIKEGFHNLPPEDIETLVWNPAHVPGDVYTDLWKAGVIVDPYFGRNGAKAQWVMYDEWWYACQFNITEDLSNQVVRIDFEGVDYSCEVWLNGHYLGSHEGAFSPFSFDVTKVLNSSKHWLASANMLMIKLDAPPQVNSKVAGRKMPWFGDYWRDLVPFGIWRPVKMVSTGACRFIDLYTNTKINKDGSAGITLEIEIENTTTESKEMSFTWSIEGHNFEFSTLTSEFKRTISPGKHIVRETININSPKLWWPWDLGDQNLYIAKVSLKEDGVNHDFTETRFGIREVSMEWNPGFTKDEVSFPRTTLINGRNHFIRSACWGGPPDIFTGRTSVDEYKKLIKLAKEANINNIRIFGWHPPEIREFYEICNEEGLTVWQDVIPLGTGNLPHRQSFIDSTIAEAIAVIKERRNHPCLIMIEGGEEMFLRSRDAMFTRSFLETLGDSLHNYVDLPYVPDSPLTCETAQKAGYKKKEAVHALGYFYSMGSWLMEDWFKSLDFPIVPELAVTSVPSIESLKKFIPENELWPPGISWGYHWADLDRLRMQNWDAFGNEKKSSLEEFVNATQDAQGIIFQLAVEHFRRAKPRTSGIALCHFITYWPDMKWGIVDNYQEKKRSYEYVQRAYQPLLVSLNFDKRRWFNNESFKGQVWVINDLYKSFPNCSVEVILKDDKAKNLKIFKNKLDKIEENSSKQMFEFEEDVLKRVQSKFYVTLTLKNEDGEIISTNKYMFLIGDQESASEQFKQKGAQLKNLNSRFTYGNYYRFFPSMTRENGEDNSGKTHNPRTAGF